MLPTHCGAETVTYPIKHIWQHCSRPPASSPNSAFAQSETRHEYGAHICTFIYRGTKRFQRFQRRRTQLVPALGRRHNTVRSFTFLFIYAKSSPWTCFSSLVSLGAELCCWCHRHQLATQLAFARAHLQPFQAARIGQ